MVKKRVVYFLGIKARMTPLKSKKSQIFHCSSKHELTESIDAAKSGDKLLAAKPVSSNDEILESTRKTKHS